MPSFHTLDTLHLTDARVLVRADLNAPVQDGVVTDATRLERLAPTIRDILASGGRPVVLSHFGRPKGAPDPAMSLAQIRGPLEEALGAPVRFFEECVGPDAERAAQALIAGEVLLLENLRFHPGEEANDPDFAAALARLGTAYVNDAFSAAHRAHASTTALAELLPAAAGRNMEAELVALDKALGAPERPLLAVVGGAKISTKISVLKNIVAKADALVIGGAMANTFLAAQGMAVGDSLQEPGERETALETLRAAEAAGCAIILPIDVVIGDSFSAEAAIRTVPADACPPGWMILDAGPATVGLVRDRLAAAKTVIWNGPLGAFELAAFAGATNAAAIAAAELTGAGRLVSVAGGGDTVAALSASGAAERFTFVSTAGGAFLEWLEGRALPGVAALEAAREASERAAQQPPSA